MITLDINIVLLIIFGAWHYSLFCGYVSDDHSGVAERKDIIPDEEKSDKGEGFWVKRLNDGLVMFYQTALFRKLGLRKVPFAWHLFSLALHMANAYLFYLLLCPIYGDTVLYAVLFWGVNPMLNQNTVWVSGRPYLIGVFLGLIALICWQNPFTFILFYGLALVTNISIFFIPLINYMLHSGAWQAKVILMSMLAVGMPILIWKFIKRFTKALVIDRDNFALKPRKFNTLVRVFAYYAWCLFVPVRMGWYHQAGFRYNEKWEKVNYLTIIGYLVLGILVFYFKFPGWFFLLGILPNSNLYATNSFLQDRYVYFASMGIALIVAPYFVQYPVAFIVAITFYATRAYMYSRQLKNDELLYRENWRNHPRSDYAVNNLSYFLIQQRRYEEARVVIERGLAITNSNKMLWYNLGITWAATGNFGNDEGKFRFIKALDCWKMCLQLEPRWTKPADDLKKLIGLLVEKGVLSIEKKDDAPNSLSVEIPALRGMENILKKKV